MPVAEEEVKPVEWTAELDALAKEPAMPLGLTPAPEEKPVPEPKVESPETPEPEQPVESASDVDVGGESESAADQPDEPVGLDADEIALAKAYDFTDDEISGFTSADLARAIAPFERGRLMREEKAPTAETKAPAVETKAPAKTPEPKVEADDEYVLDPEIVEPAIADKWNKLVAHMKERDAEREKKLTELSQFVEQTRAQEQEAVYQERLRHFDSIVNAMGDEKFGPEDWNARTPAQWKARNDLVKATSLMLGNAANEGKNLPLNSALVKRALVYAFPEEIRKQETAKVHNAIAAQSKKRTGKPTAPKRTTIAAGDPEKNPEVLQDLNRLWVEMQSENGSLAAR